MSVQQLQTLSAVSNGSLIQPSLQFVIYWEEADVSSNELEHLASVFLEIKHLTYSWHLFQLVFYP